MLAAINQSTPVIEYSLLTDSLAPFSILLASSMKLTLWRSSFISSFLYTCQGDGMGLDDINEPLPGRLFLLTTPSLCLLPAAVKLLAFIGTVQTVSTAQLNFCQTLVNKHTIIDSHSASSSSEILEILFVPIWIITLGILSGFKVPPSGITGL